MRSIHPEEKKANEKAKKAQKCERKRIAILRECAIFMR